MTNIRPGDKVEMAAMPAGDNYLIYAIVNPEQRTISITPKCNRNEHAVRLTLAVLAAHFILLLPYIFLLFLGGETWLLTTALYCFTSTIFGLYVHKKEMYAHSVQYELHNRIIECLDIFNDPHFNFKKHVGILLKTRIKSGNFIPREACNVPMPQPENSHYLHEYFYYY